MKSTNSATAAPFLEIEFASTTKATAFAFVIWFWNWSLNLACPGTSTTRIVLFDCGKEYMAVFVWSEAWVRGVSPCAS